MFQDKKNTWFISCSFIVLCLMLSSCSTLSSATKNKSNAEQVEFLILTAPSINLDVVNRPAPVRLDVFQLVRKSNFIYGSYLDLIDDENDLNGDVLFKTQHILTPDSIKSVPLSLEEGTNYLGLTTGYRDIEDASWRIALQKQPSKLGSRSSYLYLKVDQSNVFQLSKKQMKAELKEYAKRHPNDKSVTKNGKYKKPKYDYSKGVFSNQ